MPQKYREVKRDLRKAGFIVDPRRGKGSHSWWVHAKYPDLIVELSGNDGDDVSRYHAKFARDAIAAAKQRDGGA